MHYLITGGTGFIGKNLVNRLLSQHHSVTVLSRKPSDSPETVTSLDKVPADKTIDVIINLAGSPIDQRWTTSVKNELVSSRIQTTKALLTLVHRLTYKPQIIINASAVGYYNPTDFFSHQLCNDWEREALKFQHLGPRVCLMRLGVVLGKNGGILKKLIPTFQPGLGGKIGSGKQPFCWVHVEDVLSGIEHLIKTPTCQGAFNFTAPNPVTNEQFTQGLSRALKRPAFFHLPKKLVQLLFGQMGKEILLHGEKVLPEKLISTRFSFSFPTLETAFKNLISSQ